MHDFLWENSWTYRKSVEQGIEKGIEKGIRKSIDALVKTRFPALAELAKEKIADIHSENALQNVLIAMYSAETEKNAQRYLLALKSNKE